MPFGVFLKPPLCKGRWVCEAKSEGLFAAQKFRINCIPVGNSIYSLREFDMLALPPRYVLRTLLFMILKASILINFTFCEVKSF